VALRLLGDLFSPPACAACDGPVHGGRHVFCAACARTVEPCTGTGPILAFGAFGGALASAIRRLKYDNRPDLSRPLGDLLRGALSLAPGAVDLIVPVPLHIARLVHRGYNQSALLGSRLSWGLGVPMSARSLARPIETPPQAELSRALRLTNVAGAFKVVRARAIRGRRIALVDDVVTTGATLEACARALHDAGAERVIRVAVARTQ
jgi:ComF family protein